MPLRQNPAPTREDGLLELGCTVTLGPEQGITVWLTMHEPNVVSMRRRATSEKGLVDLLIVFRSKTEFDQWLSNDPLRQQAPRINDQMTTHGNRVFSLQ
jgi:hypothetical protein